MEFLIWMAIGIALMAVELVVPGGILGLIGYCAFLCEKENAPRSC